MHRSCDTLPLTAFIQALCEGDKAGIIIAGSPTDQELEEAWFGVYAHYVDLSLNMDIKYSLRLQNEISHLKARLMRIELCVRGAKLALDFGQRAEDLVEILRKDYNFPYAFDWNNPEAFTKDLQRVVSRSQRWDISAQLKQIELEAYQANQNGEKPSKVYFTSILIRLSDHAGYRLSADQLTTAEFAIRKQDYITYCEQAKIKNNGRKR